MSENASFWTSVKSVSMSTLVYSILLTPFDVVKNTQISALTSKGPIFTMKYLIRDTGIKNLWRGVIASSISTFSSNIVYYPCYEISRTHFQQINETWGTGFAAMASRSFAVLITLPIERLRTSIQGIGKGKLEFTTKGLRPTLFRDIIFSFTYFTIWENLYKELKPYGLYFDRTFSIFIGSLAAAIITHPFDVIKTKVQTRYEDFSEYDSKILRSVKTIYNNEGLQGLFIGSQARISKIVIGLMIYTNLYEFTKQLTGK